MKLLIMNEEQVRQKLGYQLSCILVLMMEAMKQGIADGLRPYDCEQFLMSLFVLANTQFRDELKRGPSANTLYPHSFN
jgi:hypothetical protein